MFNHNKTILAEKPKKKTILADSTLKRSNFLLKNSLKNKFWITKNFFLLDLGKFRSSFHKKIYSRWIHVKKNDSRWFIAEKVSFLTKNVL